MASDHRGRELHAGKRTAQERGWSTPIDPGDSYIKRSPISTSEVWEGNGKYAWAYDVDANTPEGMTIKKGGMGSLGMGKGAYSYEPRSYLKGVKPSYMVTGTTRTPARAIIAAEAMERRVAEGRDLKTGRPKK